VKIKDRINSFSELGRILRDSLEGSDPDSSSDLEDLINNQKYKNPWFTPENVRMALESIAMMLTFENLVEWTDRYPELNNKEKLLNVGVVMAGNIPLVGFHDFLSVLISGNKLIAKTSSRDPDLIIFITKILDKINHELSQRIIFTEGLLKGFDAVIATGSNNTSRYFEYYFGKYPNIIRKNRNSIAIIDGSESDKELNLLGRDVFSYFGLGCRSVSKLFLPAGYKTERITSQWMQYNKITDHNKYSNNYDYNKALFLVNREEFIDTGYLLLKESDGLSSPVAVLYYEFFDSLDDVYRIAKNNEDKIQCIIGRDYTAYGLAQTPQLWDYADGIDTMDFLLKKDF
jgi:hypothetical protein